MEPKYGCIPARNSKEVTGDRAKGQLQKVCQDRGPKIYKRSGQSV